MKKQKNRIPRIALVYDWLDTEFGGAEYVLQSLVQAFPQAELFAVKLDSKLTWIQDLTIHTSFINQLPLINSWRPLTALFSPLAFEQFDLSDFDVVISVTSFAAKGVLTSPHQTHLSYILSPPRFVYRLSESYLQPNWSTFGRLIQFLIKPITAYLKKFDQAASWRPDQLISLSSRVDGQIRASVSRQPTATCYPPVKSQAIQPDTDLMAGLPTPYLLSVGRLVPYKRVDLAIKACLLTDQKLLIVGSGPDYYRLIELAGQSAAIRPNDMSLVQFLASSTQKNILLLSQVNQVELATLYQKAMGLIAVGIDDFGLTPLEAASVGTPTVINAKSGVSEVLTADLAVWIDSSDVEAVATGFKQLNQRKFDRQKLQEVADQFSQAGFISYWQSLVENVTKV